MMCSSPRMSLATVKSAARPLRRPRITSKPAIAVSPDFSVLKPRIGWISWSGLPWSALLILVKSFTSRWDVFSGHLSSTFKAEVAISYGGVLSVLMISGFSRACSPINAWRRKRFAALSFRAGERWKSIVFPCRSSARSREGHLPTSPGYPKSATEPPMPPTSQPSHHGVLYAITRARNERHFRGQAQQKRHKQGSPDESLGFSASIQQS